MTAVDGATPDPIGRHVVPLPGTAWRVWRDAVIRSTGFPVDGLARFTAPKAAEVADAFLAGSATEADFDTVFGEACVAGLLDARDIARDPLFREAVSWQGRNVLYAVDGAAAADEHTARSSKQRQREIAVLRYWQRYCTKNESIGFFGPTTWVTLQPGGPLITVRPGPGLVRDRHVTIEHWALHALADQLAEDPLVRRWLPVSLHPHFALRDREILRPTLPPVPLSPAEAAVLALCDRRSPAWTVAQRAVAGGVPGVRRPEDVLAMFEVLVERGLLRWDADLPMEYHAEDLLRQRLSAIEDEQARARSLAAMDRLTAARDEVAAAAGDAEGVRAALSRLDSEFELITGASAQRRPGEMYAGRTICVEDTTRDLDVVIGTDLLAPLSRQLEVLLLAARWVTAESARVYLAALRELYEEMVGELGSAQVPLGKLWYLAQGLLFGSVDKPSDGVSAEFTARWAELFGLADVAPDRRQITVKVDEIAERVAAAFPAQRPGWNIARVHSPDLVICAGSVADIARGDYFAVLGEMHAGAGTLDLALMVDLAENPEELRAGYVQDGRPGRVIPLYPLSWPRRGTRVAGCLSGEPDVQLGIDVAPGADPDRLWPLAAVSVCEHDGELVAVGPDGERRALAEVFSEMIWVFAVDSFKLVAAAPHTPRISIDRLVVARETWRTTVGETGWVDTTGERALYLAVRRWRAELGLPDQVFVKLPSETKPFYLDLTSPQHIASFRKLLASGRTELGPEMAMVFTELLPSAEHAWLPDAQDRRYFCELRMNMRDPRAVRPEFDDPAVTDA